MRMTVKLRLLVAVLLLPLMTGCASLLTGNNVQMRQGASSSLVDFLYPDGEIPPPADGTLPTLELPVKVGLAFVPSRGRDTLSAAEKQELLDRVAAAFDDRPFVKSITVIPDAYLTRADGLQGMRQVARLFSADVMALVSYDQLSISAERDSALLYWTVVGALVVKGNSNEVQTMVDTAVFDVQSGELLFRAPGTHADQRNATLIDNGQDLRKLRVDGFSDATDDMIGNLDIELEELRAAIREGERVRVAWRGGGGGGGGGSTGFALLTLMLFGRLARRR